MNELEKMLQEAEAEHSKADWSNRCASWRVGAAREDVCASGQSGC